MTSPPDTSLGQFSEEPLDQVQPTPAGRREMHVVARVTSQPTANLGHLVRAVVVHHQMHFKADGEIGLDLIQEIRKELLMPMPPVAVADSRSEAT